MSALCQKRTSRLSGHIGSIPSALHNCIDRRTLATREDRMSTQAVVTCTVDRHAGAILDIFNEAIVTSTALYDYKPRSLDSMGPWFEAKAKGGYPVIGLENDIGTLLAIGSGCPSPRSPLHDRRYRRHQCRQHRIARAPWIPARRNPAPGRIQIRSMARPLLLSVAARDASPARGRLIGAWMVEC